MEEASNEVLVERHKEMARKSRIVGSNDKACKYSLSQAKALRRCQEAMGYLAPETQALMKAKNEEKAAAAGRGLGGRI